MLQLKNIVKTYAVGGGQETVPALRGVSLAFRDSEFVAVLGPSGCGKTTLLNILGGLDRYTDGDLVINGRSTKEIMSELNIKENTLKFHNKNLYGKLGVSSRKQLVEIYKLIK